MGIELASKLPCRVARKRVTMSYEEYQMHEASNRKDYEDGLITLAQFAELMSEIIVALHQANRDQY